jgi:hypothetical protein
LTAKLVLVPLLIAAITLAGARFGPRVAGVLTGLPVVAGPIVLFLAIEQGPAFAARSAKATLAGEGSLAVFCVFYGWTALRGAWWTSVAVGWAGFVASTLLLDRVPLSLAAASLVALATPLVVTTTMPRTAAPRGMPDVTGGEIALRMAAGVVLMLALTGVARTLGPHLSGLLTVFPVATTVLAVFSHRAHGAGFAVQLLRGLALGLYSLTAFFLTLALALEALGTTLGFLVASAASFAVQAGVLATTTRTRAAPPRSLPSE